MQLFLVLLAGVLSCRSGLSFGWKTGEMSLLFLDFVHAGNFVDYTPRRTALVRIDTMPLSLDSTPYTVPIETTRHVSSSADGLPMRKGL